MCYYYCKEGYERSSISLISLANLKTVLNGTYNYVNYLSSYDTVVFLLYSNSPVKLYHGDPESPTPWYREN